MQVRIPHEFFVLLYDFIFEAEKKAFLQVNDFTSVGFHASCSVFAQTIFHYVIVSC